MTVRGYFDWLKRWLKEAGVIQIWFSHKENMYKNMQQYLLWVSRPVFLE